MAGSQSGNEGWCCESVAPVRTEAGTNSGITRQSLEQAYREHSSFVWRNARRLGCDDDTAEDIVHEVFLVVSERFENFRHESSLRTWLFAITHRLVQRQLRDKLRRGVRLQRHVESLEVRSTRDLRDLTDASDYLRYLLSKLDDEKRIVFIMMELEGMTAVEIGSCLGLKAPTVESRLRMARAALTKMIERDEQRDRRWPR